MVEPAPGLPPLIAIVGSDGSGKSTISEALLQWIEESYGPAAAAHLGKQQGNTGRSLGQLPLIGRWLGGFIERKASTVRTLRTKKKAPSWFPALVMYAFTLKRVRRYRRMLALRRRGLIVVADRYPQMDNLMAGDSPDLELEAEGSRFVYGLARREWAHFEWMTSYQPDVVVRLNVDVDTACARKPDHSRESLERKIKHTPTLTFNGANIAEIDASQDLDEVLAAVKTAVAQTLAECGYQKRDV